MARNGSAPRRGSAPRLSRKTARDSMARASETLTAILHEEAQFAAGDEAQSRRALGIVTTIHERNVGRRARLERHLGQAREWTALILAGEFDQIGERPHGNAAPTGPRR